MSGCFVVRDPSLTRRRSVPSRQSPAPAPYSTEGLPSNRRPSPGNLASFRPTGTQTDAANGPEYPQTKPILTKRSKVTNCPSAHRKPLSVNGFKNHKHLQKLASFGRNTLSGTLLPLGHAHRTRLRSRLLAPWGESSWTEPKAALAAETRHRLAGGAKAAGCAEAAKD